MANYNIQTLKNATPELTEALEVAYKGVFSGHPWHEDRICPDCDTQYTAEACERFFEHRTTGKVANDCREDFSRRDDIAVKVLPEDVEDCPNCDTRLISFYPEHVNHPDLIAEALGMDTFAGYVAFDGEEPVAFSWGYAVPEEDTKSVAFSKIRPLIDEAGLDSSKAFYAAETGVVDVYQDSGVGSAVSATRLLEAADQGYELMLTRTVNEIVHLMFEGFYSGKKPEVLFKDPVKGTPWFAWYFKDLDRAKLERKISEATGQ